MLNLYSIGHFLQWFLIGHFLLNNWYIFFILSIGWELLEIILPYKFAAETYDNKILDIIINYLGFYLGNYIRK